MPNSAAGFDHLDHVLNDLVAHGVVAKTWEHCYCHNFKNGKVQHWRVDPMIAAVSAAIKDGTAEVAAMTADEISTFAASIAAEGCVDMAYARLIPAERRTSPVLVVGVTPDLHPDAGCIVVDGNHRIMASHEDGLPCFYVVVPESIERRFRV